MLHIIGKIPHNVTVACSGGLDSMSIVQFLLNGKRNVTVAHFNHDTVHSKDAQSFVQNYCENKKIKLHIGHVRGSRKKQSLEEFWRNERYKFFNSLETNFIITGHHLDDAVETWVMSSLHGQPKLIPYKRGKNIYRPFLLTSKRSFHDFSLEKNIEWVEDPSNQSCSHIRNLVRHKIIPEALKVNPGLRKTIRKKIIELYKNI